MLALLFVLMFITYLDRVCFSTTAGALGAELGLSLTQIGAAGSAFVLGYVLFEIPGGWMADRFGARLMLTRVVVWWSAFTALTGAAWSFGSLVAVRFLFGCGEAGAFPGATSAIARWFPRHELGRAQSVVMFGSRVGFALTSWIVVALMADLGWRAVYWAFAVLGIVWAIAWSGWFRDTPDSHGSVGAGELSAIQDGRIASGRAPQAPWGALIANRSVLGLCAMYSGYTWGLYFYIQWLPTYLVQARNIELPDIGPVTAAVLVSGAVASLAGGWISDRLVPLLGVRAARRIPAMVGLVAAAAFLALAATVTDTWLALACLGLSFGAAELILAVTWATCLDIGGPSAGVVSGTMNSLGQVSGALAPWLMGLMVDRSGSWEPPLLVTAAYYVVSAALWLVIDPRQRLRGGNAEA